MQGTLVAHAQHMPSFCRAHADLMQGLCKAHTSSSLLCPSGIPRRQIFAIKGPDRAHFKGPDRTVRYFPRLGEARAHAVCETISAMCIFFEKAPVLTNHVATYHLPAPD